MKIETIDDINSVLPYRDRLEVLAEEASELTQAALKVIRAGNMSENPTPMSYDLARESLDEEIVDVLVALSALGFDCGIFNVESYKGVDGFKMMREAKVKRWCKRISDKIQEDALWKSGKKS